MQSIVFDRTLFTPEEARSWARANGYKSTSVDIQPNTVRIRQSDPSGFVRGSYLTHVLDNGVALITAEKK